MQKLDSLTHFIYKNVYFYLITLFQQTQRLTNYARNIVDSYHYHLVII